MKSAVHSSGSGSFSKPKERFKRGRSVDTNRFRNAAYSGASGSK
jgi:hypothetical protein